MYSSIFFHFVKDSVIDPNEAFLQNIINLQLDLYNGFIKSYFEKEQDEIDKLLKDLFEEIETIIDQNDLYLIGLVYKNLTKEARERNQEMIEDFEEKLKILKIMKKEGLQVQDYINNDKLLKEFKEEYQEKYELRDRLMEICTKKLNLAKIEISLRLYCLFVNSFK